MMMRRLAGSILTLVVATAAVGAEAREGAIRAGAAKFVATVKTVASQSPFARVAATNQAKDRAAILDGRKALVTSGQWVGHQAVHFAETMLLLGTLAAVEAVMQERHLAPLRDQSTDTIEIVKRASSNLVNDTSLYMSMIGGGVAGTAAAYPLGAMGAQIMSAIPNEFVGRLMAGGVSSFVTFVGWEAGSRLWEEAIYNMALDAQDTAKTKEDFARVESDIALARQLRFLDVIRGRGTPDEQRVFGIVMNNALEILTFAHPERTSAWLQNTFRLNVLTGEFVTTVTMMTLAGTSATMLSGVLLGMATGATTGAKAGAAVGFWAGPVGSVVAGTAAGFVGGIAGGVLAHYTPEGFKNNVTAGIRRTQLQANSVQLNNNGLRLEDARAVYDFHGDKTKPYWADEIHKTLEARRAIRNAIGTTLFTQIYDYATKYQEAEVTLAAVPDALLKTNDPAKRAEIKDLETEYGLKLARSRKQTEKYLAQLLAFYEREVLFFDGWTATDAHLPASVREEVSIQRDDMERALGMMTYFYAGLFPDQRERLGLHDISDEAVPQVTGASNVLLNQFYLRGYEEKHLIEPSKTAPKALADAS